MFFANAHPTILREYRSMTTARYNQPSVVLIYVISDTHPYLVFQFGSIVLLEI